MFERFFQNSGSGDGDPIQRRGLARGLEIILDNLTRLLVSSLLCLVCLIPWAAAIVDCAARKNEILVGMFDRPMSVKFPAAAGYHPARHCISYDGRQIPWGFSVVGKETKFRW